MKTSEVFRRVRTHLRINWTHETPSHRRYICTALAQLYLDGMIGDKDRTKGIRVIRAHLDGYASLESWLLDKHNIEVRYSNADVRKIMATRKAWLTHLIEHYEAKGD